MPQVSPFLSPLNFLPLSVVITYIYSVTRGGGGCCKRWVYHRREKNAINLWKILKNSNLKICGDKFGDTYCGNPVENLWKSCGKVEGDLGER